MPRALLPLPASLLLSCAPAALDTATTREDGECNRTHSKSSTVVATVR